MGCEEGRKAKQNQISHLGRVFVRVYFSVMRFTRRMMYRGTEQSIESISIGDHR